MQTNKTKKILVVDDVELNRAILYELFGNDYDVIEAENGKEALELIKEHEDSLALVLLDIVMPVMDGLAALKEMNRCGYLKSIPVVMVTAESTESISLKMYELGASDVISKPFNPAVVRQRVNNIAELYDYRRNLEEIVTNQTVTLEEQALKLKQTNVFIIDTLCTAVEFRNGESGTHIVRIRDITRLLLKEFGNRYPRYSMTDNQIEVISNAAAMHDIGKIAVPDAILNKPGRLTHEEFEIMKLHTTKGCELLEKLNYVQDQEYYEYCYEICRHHHERWDGRGYPDGIAGDSIPIWSQVVAVADVYDALVSQRAYKKAFSHEKAMSMIVGGECGMFKPELLQCFMEISRELMDLYRVISKETVAVVQPLTYDSTKQDENLQRILKLLEIERTKYQIIADTSGDVVFEYDVASDKVTLSENASYVFNGPIELTGLVYGDTSLKFIDGDGKKILRQMLAEINESQNGKVRETLRLKTRNGDFEWFELVAKGFFADEDRGRRLTDVIGKFVNVNAIKTEVNYLRKEAQRDGLTSLNNRETFQEKASCEFATRIEEGASLFLIDLDDFELLNETYGREMGDKVLRFVGESLRFMFRSSDILGRIDGDQFAVFMPAAVEEQVLAQKAAYICEAFSKAFLEGDTESCGFSGSIGIARYPYDAEDYETLLRNAEAALKQAKANGKNAYAFYHNL